MKKITEKRKSTPRVIFQKNTTEKEGEMFFAFLNHPKFPTHRKFIFNVFPELEKILKNCKNKKEERREVEEFVKSFYKVNRKKISEVGKESEKEITNKSKKALDILGNAMEYSWREDSLYIATPTILPFSPFGDDVFYFSILRGVLKNENIRVIEIMVHEISHFIFFDILKSIEKEEGLRPSKTLIHYAKEVLTAALFRNKPISKFLGTAKYIGNPEIRELYIVSESKRRVSLIDYIGSIYTQAKDSKTPFKIFLKDFMLMMLNCEGDIEKKEKLWRKYGRSIFSNNKILLEYQREIIIRKQQKTTYQF